MRHGRVGRLLLTLALATASCSSRPPSVRTGQVRPGHFDVVVETGRRITTNRDDVAYDLYVPRPEAGRPAPPWPALVLAHGFARNRAFHANTARSLAGRGVVVLAADLASLLGGEPAREANVASTRDHVAWLRERSATPGDVLFGLVDPERVALAGFSAGGAVAFEAAATGARVRAVVLLDAVPWKRTIAAARAMPATRLVSLRSEPSACNGKGSVQKLLAGLGFESEDVRIVGATHCDAEDPTDGLCRLFCGGTSEEGRAAYRRLLTLFLEEALEVPPVEESPDGWDEAIRRGVEDGSLASGRVVPGR